MIRNAIFGAGLFLAAGCVCGVPGIVDEKFSCTTDRDCVEPYTCQTVGAGKVCVKSDGGGGVGGGGGGGGVGGGGGGVGGGGGGVGGGGGGVGGGGGGVGGGGGGGAGGGTGTDAGTDAGTADAGCAGFYFSEPGPQFGGRSSIIDVSGIPRAMWLRGAVHYSECTGGCTGPAATWSAVLNLDNTSGTVTDLRPILVPDGAGLSAFWLTSTGTTATGAKYSNCPNISTCSNAASWNTTSVVPSAVFSQTTYTASLDVLGSLKAVAFGGTDGGTAFSVYGECTSNCSASANNWSYATFNFAPRGAAIALEATDAGTLLRTAVFGETTGGQMLYGECTTGCTDSANWTTTLGLGDLYLPDLVIDRQGLPRVFARTGGGGGGALVALRCTARPCTNAANWTAPVTMIAALADYAMAGTTPDGRVFFTSATSASNLTVGFESGNNYTLVTPTPCNTPLKTDAPAAYVGLNDKLRVLYMPAGTTRVDYMYQQ